MNEGRQALFYPNKSLNFYTKHHNLPFLGWIFVPYVMVFVQWKRLNVTWRVFEIIWALLALSSFANSMHKDNTTQKASAPIVDSKTSLSPQVEKTMNHDEQKAEAPKEDNQVKPEQPAPKVSIPEENESIKGVTSGKCGFTTLRK